jgi:hypothetical protein
LTRCGASDDNDFDLLTAFFLHANAQRRTTLHPRRGGFNSVRHA